MSAAHQERTIAEAAIPSARRQGCGAGQHGARETVGASSNVDAVKDNSVIVAPPYNGSESGLVEIIGKLGVSLKRVFEALPKR